jgi:hypothetical protein
MNVLVAITSWNQNHEQYLQTVLNNYTASFADVSMSYVLSINYTSSMTLPPNTTQLTKSYNSSNYCWNNHNYINANFKGYDYIINSDDDILVTRDNFNYYVSASNQLSHSYIPGFLSVEMPDTGSPYLLTMTPRLARFKIKSVESGSYFVPMNIHSACSIVDTGRYEHALSRSLSRCPFTSSGYNSNDLARTDIYRGCNFTKVISYEAVKSGSALVQHLPNKYWNKQHAKNQRLNHIF